MNKQLFVKPYSWSSINPGVTALKSNPSLSPSIQFFGYTSDNKSIYVRFPRKSTFILKFTEAVDDEIASNISDILSPTSITGSGLDPTILIIRAPEISPFEFTSNEESATWIAVSQDPYGELVSLWETLDIGPYQWLQIDDYAAIPGKYTSCDMNIRTSEDNISGFEDIINMPIINHRLFFWDIETFSKSNEFPDALNPDDYIFMISVITVINNDYTGYVIIKGDVNEDLLTRNDMVIIKATDESDLINKFFTIYNNFGPDRQIYYNGDSFDMPYLLDRTKLNKIKIPNISKILSLTPTVSRHSYPSPFGREFAKTLNLPGTEIIDLLHYYRLFYPYLKNHRLDTVSRKFIGEGKTDLTIDEMMHTVRTNDINKLAKVVDYSYIDSFRMYELWTETNVKDNIETLCNNLGLDDNIILRSSLEEVITRAVYNIDAGSALLKGQYDNPLHLKEAVKGIYRNVYVYDYSEIYRQIMITSEQLIAMKLAERLQGAPSKLITTAFYSGYVDRKEILLILNNLLNDVLKTGLIIAIEPFIVRSIGPLDLPWLTKLYVSPWYISVSKASYIILDDNGGLEMAGLAKLCRPPFPLANDIIREYLLLAYNKQIFKMPDIKTYPIEKFYLTIKLTSTDTTTTNQLKASLIAQYGLSIATWVSVKYVVTQRGPVLISKLLDTDVIDYKYYTTELNKYIKELTALKISNV